jgi:hypothetical protein
MVSLFLKFEGPHRGFPSLKQKNAWEVVIASDPQLSIAFLFLKWLQTPETFLSAMLKFKRRKRHRRLLTKMLKMASRRPPTVKQTDTLLRCRLHRPDR